MLDNKITDGEIYCKIGDSKKAILMIDDKVVVMELHFDDDNDNIFIMFDNINDESHCACEMGRASYVFQQEAKDNMHRKQKMFYPHEFCGYCGKKFPPTNHCLIKLVDVQDVTKKEKINGKIRAKSKKNSPRRKKTGKDSV